MCDSKAEGGRRCPHSTKIATIRRTAKRRYLKESDYPRKRERLRAQQDAVDNYCYENTEFALGLLPSKTGYEVKDDVSIKGISKLPVIKENFSGKAIDSGASVSTKNLYDEYQRYMDKITEDESDAFRQYAMTAFEYVNTYLRKKDFDTWAKANILSDDTKEGFTERRIKPLIKNLDSIVSKAEQDRKDNGEYAPRKLYRYVELPAGVTSADYMDKYYREGEGFSDSGFMSTSTDPEFVAGYIKKERARNKNANFIVFEILTARGASLQDKEQTRPGNLQSFEHEVLLPRNVKHRIAGVKKRRGVVFTQDRPDLYMGLSPGYRTERFNDHVKGMRVPVGVVQLIDDDLLDK